MSGDLVIAKVKGFPWSSSSPCAGSVLRAYDFSCLQHCADSARGLG